eukprot:7590530-Pyramimonas_sp.AAC.1
MSQPAPSGDLDFSPRLLAPSSTGQGAGHASRELRPAQPGACFSFARAVGTMRTLSWGTCEEEEEEEEEEGGGGPLVLPLRPAR